MIKTTRFIYCDNCGKEIKNVKNTYSGNGTSVYGVNGDFIINIFIDEMERKRENGEIIGASDRVDLCDECYFTIVKGIARLSLFKSRYDAIAACAMKEGQEKAL